MENLSISVCAFLVDCNSLINLDMINSLLPINDIFIEKKTVQLKPTKEKKLEIQRNEHNEHDEHKEHTCDISSYGKQKKHKIFFPNQLTIIVRTPNNFICNTGNEIYDQK